jgi:hypothetical protein
MCRWDSLHTQVEITPQANVLLNVTAGYYPPSWCSSKKITDLDSVALSSCVLSALGCVLLMCRRVALVNWRAARDAAKAARQVEAATLQDTQATLQVSGQRCYTALRLQPAALSCYVWVTLGFAVLAADLQTLLFCPSINVCM